MAKYTKDFKQQVLDRIAKEGHLSVIRELWQTQKIRPETIRLWMRPAKAKALAEKNLKDYHQSMNNLEFRQKRCERSLENRNPNIVYKYSELEQQREFTNLCKAPGNYHASPANNRIILTHQQHFYDIEREMFKDPEIRKKLYANRLKYIGKNKKVINDKELLRGFKISGIHVGYSHFSSLWIKAFIEEFNAQSVYDPCGGWGHRMLGAHQIKYIYNDIWDKTVVGISTIKDKFKLNNVEIHNNPAEEFTPTQDYDAVFTCPPYSDVEIYGNGAFGTDKAYEAWWASVVSKMIKHSVKTIGIVINGKYKNSVIIPIINQGYSILREQTLYVGHNHFAKSTNTTRSEVLIIFKQQ